MAKKEKPFDGAAAIDHMNRYGTEQILPGTGRRVKLRSLDAESLLRDGKMPDLLTPLVIKSVYQELSDRELREFVGSQRGSIPEALSLLETIDFVVEKTLVSGATTKSLTLAEKRWIFRLVMGPAELLITFRLDETPDVEPMDEGDEVRATAEPDTEGN